MKALFLVILVALCVSARAQTTYTTEIQRGDSTILSNILAAQLVMGSTTNVASFTIVNTNWVDGATYTNTTGRAIYIIAPCKYTTAAILGNAGYALKIPGSATNTFGENTLLTVTIAASRTNQVVGFVTNGGAFTFTNASAGAGNTAAIVSGGQYIVF